MSDKTGR